MSISPQGRATATATLLIAAGFFIRLHGLGAESLWIDEAHTAAVARMPVLELLKTVALDNHPPLSFLVERGALLLLGDSEAALRLPSLLFGTLTIVAAGAVAKRLFGETAGLIVALITALSPFQLHYSQEARSYELLALLTACSFLSLIRFAERPTAKRAATYTAATVLLLYTHYYGFFAVAAQNVLFFAGVAAGARGYRRGVATWLLVQGTVLLLFAPWAGAAIRAVSDRLSTGPILPRPTARKLIGPFISWAGSPLSFLLFGVLSLNALSLPFRSPSDDRTMKSLFLPIGEPPDKERRSDPARVFLLAVWITISLYVPIVMSWFVSPFFVTRYAIGGSIAFYILVAAGIISIGRSGVRKAVIGAVILLSLAGIRRYHHAVNKEPWREIAAMVDARAQEGDLLLFNAPFCEPPFDYYSKRAGLRRASFPDPYGAVERSDLGKLDTLIAPFDRIWFIDAYSRDKDGLVRDRLDEARRFTAENLFPSEASATGKKVTVDVRLYDGEKTP